MNVRLNSIIARHRTAELQHAGEQARLARGVSMSGRKLRHRNVITRLKARPARVLGALIVPAMLAALVFGAPAAMGDPVGQISEFSVGPNTMPGPAYIAPGADGNLWFTEPCARQEGSPEACQAQWTDWAGYTARTGLYPFDGYTWQRDGNPIPGQTTATYTPTTADVGHQLGCRLTVSYSLPFSVTATSTSQAITVQSAPPPPPTPALSALDITPRMFTLTGRRVGGRCLPLNRSDRGERSCIRRVALRVRFTLSVGATVTFAIERVVPGRLTRGWCSTLTRGDRRHRPCTRQVMRRGKTVINGRAGADEFTFTGKTDGRALVPGSYRLLATPTADGIAGQRQQTTFELKR